MAWSMKHEHLDLARGQHVVIYHNPDVLVPDEKTGKMVPVEHHLINHLTFDGCPACGRHGGHVNGELEDFEKIKADTHEALNAHHRRLMTYTEKHRHVRLGSGPKR